MLVSDTKDLYLNYNKGDKNVENFFSSVIISEPEEDIEYDLGGIVPKLIWFSSSYSEYEGFEVFDTVAKVNSFLSSNLLKNYIYYEYYLDGSFENVDELINYDISNFNNSYSTDLVFKKFYDTNLAEFSSLVFLDNTDENIVKWLFYIMQEFPTFEFTTPESLLSDALQFISSGEIYPMLYYLKNSTDDVVLLNVGSDESLYDDFFDIQDEGLEPYEDFLDYIFVLKNLMDTYVRTRLNIQENEIEVGAPITILDKVVVYEREFLDVPESYIEDFLISPDFEKIVYYIYTTPNFYNNEFNYFLNSAEAVTVVSSSEFTSFFNEFKNLLVNQLTTTVLNESVTVPLNVDKVKDLRISTDGNGTTIVVIKENGDVYAMGDMPGLGGNYYFDETTTFQRIPELSNIESMYIYGGKFFFVNTVGDVYSYGSNQYDLGHKSTTVDEYIKKPLIIQGLSKIVKINGGPSQYANSYFINESGELFVLGDFGFSKSGLQDYYKIIFSTPYKINTPKKVVDVYDLYDNLRSVLVKFDDGSTSILKKNPEYYSNQPINTALILEPGFGKDITVLYHNQYDYTSIIDGNNSVKAKGGNGSCIFKGFDREYEQSTFSLVLNNNSKQVYANDYGIFYLSNSGVVGYSGTATFTDYGVVKNGCEGGFSTLKTPKIKLMSVYSREHVCNPGFNLTLIDENNVIYRFGLIHSTAC